MKKKKNFKGIYHELAKNTKPKKGKAGTITLAKLRKLYKAVSKIETNTTMIGWIDENGRWNECDIKDFKVSKVTGK